MHQVVDKEVDSCRCLSAGGIKQGLEALVRFRRVCGHIEGVDDIHDVFLRAQLRHSRDNHLRLVNNLKLEIPTHHAQQINEELGILSQNLVRLHALGDEADIVRT